MRIATFQIGGKQRVGILAADPARAKLIDAPFAMRELIGFCSDSANRLEDLPTHDVEIRGAVACPPVPDPGKLICLAANYREHITESGFAAPLASDFVTPQLFLKPSTSLLGNDAEVVLHPNNHATGWEVELAVVIGKRGRNIAEERALSHVFGYTILNDLSERRLNAEAQRRTRENDCFFDWLAGKWFDGFAPCGPCIATADEIADPHGLEMRLWVNGALRQHGHTADMITRIPELIAYCSSIMTLEPGDLISTGTPAGAGLGGGDKELADSDEVLCEIPEIGNLRTRARRTH